MRQIITRVDDDLADALKRQASRAGESVNSYLTRLLRAAVSGAVTPRHEWKTVAIANGRLLSRESGVPMSRKRKTLSREIQTPSGYARDVVSDERRER